KTATNAFENCYWLRGSSVVVADQRVNIVSVRPNHRNRRIWLCERQEVVLVLQQHQRLARSLQSELTVRLAVVLLKTNLRIRIQGRRIKHAKAKARRKQATKSTIQIGLSEESLLERLEYRVALSLDTCSGIPTNKIRACLERHTHTFFHGLGEVMSVKDVGDGSA